MSETQLTADRNSSAKDPRFKLALLALAAVIGVNVWLWWPATRAPGVAGVERMGGTVTVLTGEAVKGRVSVKLPETVTDSDLEQMAALDQLQPAWIFLSGKQVGDRGVASLARLSSLKGLALFDTKISDECLFALKDLTELETLNLDKNAITDRGLESIATMPQLHGVSVRATLVTRQGVEKLQTARPKLIVNSNFDPDDD